MKKICPLSGHECKQDLCAWWRSNECGILSCMHSMDCTLDDLDFTIGSAVEELHDIARAMQAQLPRPMNRRHSLDE